MKPRIGRAPCSAFPGMGGPGAACRRTVQVATDPRPAARIHPKDCTRSPFSTMKTPAPPRPKVQTKGDSTCCHPEGKAENP